MNMVPYFRARIAVVFMRQLYKAISLLSGRYVHSQWLCDIHERLYYIPSWSMSVSLLRFLYIHVTPKEEAYGLYKNKPVRLLLAYKASHRPVTGWLPAWWFKIFITAIWYSFSIYVETKGLFTLVHFLSGSNPASIQHQRVNQGQKCELD